MQWDASSVAESQVQECSSLLVLWQAILPLWPCGLKEAVSMSARRSVRWKFPSLSLQSTTNELENVDKSESLCLMIHSFLIRLGNTENKLPGSLCHKQDRTVNKAKDLFQRQKRLCYVSVWMYSTPEWSERCGVKTQTNRQRAQFCIMNWQRQTGPWQERLGNCERQP